MTDNYNLTAIQWLAQQTWGIGNVQCSVDTEDGCDLQVGDKEMCQKNPDDDNMQPIIYFILWSLRNLWVWQKSISDALDVVAEDYSSLYAQAMIKSFSGIEEEIEKIVETENESEALTIFGAVFGLLDMAGLNSFVQIGQKLQIATGQLTKVIPSELQFGSETVIESTQDAALDL